MNGLGIYYLYRHSYVDSGLPFYIGIGTINIEKNTLKGQYHRAFNKKPGIRVLKRLKNES